LVSFASEMIGSIFMAKGWGYLAPTTTRTI
jgi:hypothetical protein